MLEVVDKVGEGGVRERDGERDGEGVGEMRATGACNCCKVGAEDSLVLNPAKSALRTEMGWAWALTGG